MLLFKEIYNELNFSKTLKVRVIAGVILTITTLIILPGIYKSYIKYPNIPNKISIADIPDHLGDKESEEAVILDYEWDFTNLDYIKTTGSIMTVGIITDSKKEVVVLLSIVDSKELTEKELLELSIAGTLSRIQYSTYQRFKSYNPDLLKDYPYKSVYFMNPYVGKSTYLIYVIIVTLVLFLMIIYTYKNIKLVQKKDKNDV